jgi:hypothetical protein
MPWIEENKQKLRMVILILMVLAFLGPWVIGDLINVPAQYSCYPYIRLEGDFCGMPITGIQIPFQILVGILSLSTGPVTGTTDFAGWWRVFLISLLCIALFIHLINAICLTQRGDRPRLHKFHLRITGLVLILALILGILNYLRVSYALWGIWLYIGCLISILILEGILLNRTKTDQLA